MKTQRKTYNAQFKAKGALEALKGQKTMNELAAQYGGHPHQITPWKKQALDAPPQIFSDHRAKTQKAEADLKAALYPPIGQLTMELDWLKKI